MKFARPDLATVTKESSLIAFGTISKRESFLWGDGSDIDSAYIFEPTAILKGSVPRSVKFDASGGRILTGGIDGILEIQSNSEMKSAAALAQDPYHPIVKETRNLTESDVIKKVQLLLSKSKEEN